MELQLKLFSKFFVDQAKFSRTIINNFILDYKNLIFKEYLKWLSYSVDVEDLTSF